MSGDSLPPRGARAKLAKLREGPPKEPWGAFLATRCTLLAWVVTAPLLAAAVLRLVFHDGFMWLVWINGYTQIAYLPVYPALAVALICRRWRLAGVAVCIAILHLFWIWPDYRSARPIPAAAQNAPRLRVFSSNLLMVNRQPQGIVQEIQVAHPDVLLLQEYSSTWDRALASSGIAAAYPNRTGIVREDSFGTAIFSKLPLTQAEVFQVEDLPMTRATVHIGDRILRLYNVHSLPPRTISYTMRWHRQMQRLIEALKAERGLLAAIGDFNATQHSSHYETLAALGLHAAHTDRGRGTAVTFPNGIFPLPEMRLDHALLSPGVVCLQIAEGEGRGSDHKPLIIDLALLPADY